MPWAVSFACGYLRTKNDHGQTTMPGVSHKSKHMPGKERYQSRMRLLVKGSPSAPRRRIRSRPPNGSRQTSWREGVLAAHAGAAKGRWWRDVEVVRVGLRKRDALALSSQGSAAAHAVRRRRRRGALERSWPWGPWVLFFCAHSICDNSRGWREDGRTTAIEVDG